MNIRKFLKQKLVYWRRTGTNTSGQPTYATPVEMICRWEDAQAEIITPSAPLPGRTVIANSHIYTETDMVVGSWVFLGTLADWRALPGYPRLPDFNQGGREVTRAMRTPDLRARKTIYEWWL